LVIIGTPTDLRRYLKLNKEAVKVNYEFKNGKGLEKLVKNFAKKVISFKS
jgi:predicted GTPase